VPFEDFDVRVALHALDQRRLHCPPGGVGRVGDAPVAVAPLPGEVELGLVVVVAGEGHPLFDQPFDRMPAAFHDEPDGIVVAEARSGDVGIADMVPQAVGAIQDRRDASLGPAGGAHEELQLGH
jgi:hypothetical protein